VLILVFLVSGYLFCTLSCFQPPHIWSEPSVLCLLPSRCHLLLISQRIIKTTCHLTFRKAGFLPGTNLFSTSLHLTGTQSAKPTISSPQILPQCYMRQISQTLITTFSFNWALLLTPQSHRHINMQSGLPSTQSIQLPSHHLLDMGNQSDYLSGSFTIGER